MSILTTILIVFNLLVFVGLIIVWKKISKRPKDDPRISRGLQLLQSKISVLEDLSDRTDIQVKQLIALIESKTRQLQGKIFESEKQVQRIDQSMQKSLEVADIFQDKIPHEEIIERQNTVKYIQAAQLAHQGKTVDEIVKLVGLPKGEVEFIAKVNKKDLVFDKENLPTWAKKQSENFFDGADSEINKYSVEKVFGNSMNDAFEVPKASLQNIDNLDKKFKQACRDHEEAERLEDEQRIDFAPTIERTKEWTHKVVDQTADVVASTAKRISEKSKEMISVDLDMDKLVTAGGFVEDEPEDDILEFDTDDYSITGDGIKNMSVTEILDNAKRAAGSTAGIKSSELQAQSSVKVIDEAIVRKVIFPKINKDGSEI